MRTPPISGVLRVPDGMTREEWEQALKDARQRSAELQPLILRDVPVVEAAGRCEYCGSRQAEGDKCPNCGAPY